MNPQTLALATGLAALSIAASAARAQNTRLIFEASPDGMEPYSSRIDVLPGSTAYVQLRVQLVNAGTNTVLGFAGITHQPTLTNWRDGDQRLPWSDIDCPDCPPPTLGRLIPFASAGMGPMSASGLLTHHIDPGGILRFAGANNITPTTNRAWGVGSGQLPLLQNPTGFATGTDVLVFRYAVRLTSPDTSPRDLIASTDPDTILQRRGGWYTQPNGTRNLLAPIGDAAENIVPAVIHVVPSAGVAPLILIAATLAARRRRIDR